MSVGTTFALDNPLVCVTTTVAVCPPAVTVRFAVRSSAESLALSVVNVTVAFPSPFSGVALSQLGTPLNVHATFEVMANVFCSPFPDPTVTDGVTDKLACMPDCVTCTVLDRLPSEVVTINVQLRYSTDVFGAAVTNTSVVPAFPEEGLTEIHEGNPLIDHDVLLVTCRLMLPPPA